jgi:hypothetical protein
MLTRQISSISENNALITFRNQKCTRRTSINDLFHRPEDMNIAIGEVDYRETQIDSLPGIDNGSLHIPAYYVMLVVFHKRNKYAGRFYLYPSQNFRVKAIDWI